MNKCILHREIGIDVGHRVPDHGSKCRNPHGHRYRIIATCEGPVISEAGNEENGMVIDFSNVKKYMMDFLDSVFDHGFVVSKYDTVMMNMFFPNQDPHKVHFDFTTDWNRQLYDYVEGLQERDLSKVKPITLQRTLVSKQDPNGMKVIVVGYAPTAENLAKHMFDLLRQPIRAHYGRDIRLVNIRLYETPNGWVDYPGMQFNAAY